MSERVIRRLQQRERRKLFRTGELVAAGLDARRIERAVADGLLVRPEFAGAGRVHGVLGLPGIEDDPDLDECLVMFLVGGSGVLAGQYAAMRHGIATCLPHAIEVLVDSRTVLAPRPGLKVRRTRRPESLSIGVETRPTGIGVPVRMTSKARTVVDLMRARDRNSDDWRHGLEALHAYLDEGGSPSELIEIASRFEKWVPAAVETACHAAQPAEATL